MSAPKPKRGLRFEHAHWLDDHNRPLACVVTAVRYGVVYWRPTDGGGATYIPMDDFPSIVKRILPDA